MGSQGMPAHKSVNDRLTYTYTRLLQLEGNYVAAPLTVLQLQPLRLTGLLLTPTVRPPTAAVGNKSSLFNAQ